MKELHEADESEKMESYLLENSNLKKIFYKKINALLFNSVLGHTLLIMNR